MSSVRFPETGKNFGDKAPGNVTTGSLHFHITSRADFIRLFYKLGEAIPSARLYNPKEPFTVIVQGGIGSGKSLAVQAVMQGIDDAYTLQDAQNAPATEHMFIEQKPCEADDNVYVTYAPLHRNERIKLWFSSACWHSSNANKIRHVFRRAGNKAIEHGALFLTGRNKNTHMGHIVINVGHAFFNHKPHDAPQFKHMSIRLQDASLLEDPAFCAYWQELETLKKNADISPPPQPAGGPG